MFAEQFCDAGVNRRWQGEIENTVAFRFVVQFAQVEDFLIELVEILRLVVRASQVVIDFDKLGKFFLFFLFHLGVLVNLLGEKLLYIERTSRITEEIRFRRQ